MSKSRLFQPSWSRSVARPHVEVLDNRIVPATLSVTDAILIEGNAGTRYALVSVTLDAPSRQTVAVRYATVDGTAKAGSDYRSTSGKLTFAPGETSKTVAVPVYGDRLAEANESFTLRLSEAQRAWIGDSRGIVTLVEDEPQIRIGDAAGTVVYSEGTAIGTTLHFNVSLAVAYDQAVTVNYATANGTATAGADYLATSGTLTFAPGELTKTLVVEVIGNDSGLDEWFAVNLSGAFGNTRILDGQGVGTIYFYVEQPSDPGCGCECTRDHPYYPNC